MYGKDVRESLAKSMEETGNLADETKTRQDSLESQFQNVLDETTGKDVISAPEITAARGSHPNLKDRLDTEHTEVMSSLAQTEEELEQKSNLSNKKVSLDNKDSTDTAPQFESANFGGSENIKRRGFVNHHYNDAEMYVLDNVGEGNVFFLLRNANNPTRRPDKDPNFYGTGDFFKLQNMYYNPTKQALEAVTVFELKNNGNLVWGHQGAEFNQGIQLINNQPSSNGKFAFTLKNMVQNNNLLDLQCADGKTALFIQTPLGTRTDIISSTAMTSGMKIIASRGILSLDAETSIQFEKKGYSKTTTGWAFLGRFLDNDSRPLAANSPGERGDFFVNSSYAFFCVAPNSWVRVAVSSW